MFKPGDPLPPAVLASLAQGRTIDAIKQLREAHGLSLKEAKDIVDAHARPAAASHSASHSAMARPTGFSASTAMGSVPDTVQHALAQGNKIEAIRLLREHAGIGLKEAKDRVDALDVSRQRHADGLAPGVPQNGGFDMGCGRGDRGAERLRVPALRCVAPSLGRPKHAPAMQRT